MDANFIVFIVIGSVIFFVGLLYDVNKIKSKARSNFKKGVTEVKLKWLSINDDGSEFSYFAYSLSFAFVYGEFCENIFSDMLYLQIFLALLIVAMLLVFIKLFRYRLHQYYLDMQKKNSIKTKKAVQNK